MVRAEGTPRSHARGSSTGFDDISTEAVVELSLVVTGEATEYQNGGVKLCKLRCARSALGPCRNGPVWASAGTSGRQRFRGTAVHPTCSSCSWDDASGRFGLWSRRSDVRNGGIRRVRHGYSGRRRLSRMASEPPVSHLG